MPFMAYAKAAISFCKEERGHANPYFRCEAHFELWQSIYACVLAKMLQLCRLRICMWLGRASTCAVSLNCHICLCSCQQSVTCPLHMYMSIFNILFSQSTLLLNFRDQGNSKGKYHFQRQDIACTLHNRWSSRPGGKSRPLQLLLEIHTLL